MKKYSDFRKNPAKQFDNFINTTDFKDIYNMIQKLQTPPNLVLKKKHSSKDKQESQNIIFNKQIIKQYEKDDTTNVDSEIPNQSINSFEVQQIDNFGRNLHRRHNTENYILTNNSEYFGSVHDLGNWDILKQQNFSFSSQFEEQKSNQKQKLIQKLFLLTQKINQTNLNSTQIQILQDALQNLENILPK